MNRLLRIVDCRLGEALDELEWRGLVERGGRGVSLVLPECLGVPVPAPKGSWNGAVRSSTEEWGSIPRRRQASCADPPQPDTVRLGPGLEPHDGNDIETGVLRALIGRWLGPVSHRCWHRGAPSVWFCVSLHIPKTF